jgi:hypothetical protein
VAVSTIGLIAGADSRNASAAAGATPRRTIAPATGTEAHSQPGRTTPANPATGTAAELPDGRRHENTTPSHNASQVWVIFSRTARFPASDEIRQAWSGTTHSLEVLDATLYSIKRKRTIEMREDVISEQATFKALMAAGGCFMLLWAFFILLLAAFGSIFERLLGFNPAGPFWLPLLLLPLVIFLAAQLLQLLFRKETKPQSEPPGPK